MRYVNLRLECDAFPDSVFVRRASGVEGISQLFRFELQAVCPDGAAAEVEDVVGRNAILVFEDRDTTLRTIHGLLCSAQRVFEDDSRRDSYRLEFVPRMWNLTQRETLDVFLDMTIPDIVKKKLEESGLQDRKDFQLRLRRSYEPRDYVVQYNESDFDFVSRLCEHYGISYFFEDGIDREVVVFTDDNSGFERVAGVEDAQTTTLQRKELVLDYRPGETDSHLQHIEVESVPIARRYIVRDYNYRKPQVDLLGSAPIVGGSLGQVVEYGPHARSPEECASFAGIRAEEIACRKTLYRGRSDVAQMNDGATFRINGLPGRAGLQLLLIEVKHELEQPLFDNDDIKQRVYHANFTAVPFSSQYRPLRTTPRPKVHGTLTGIIDKSEDPKYAQIDDQGRYWVRLLFDTAGPGELRASKPIRMAQPHSGAGYGMHFPLRPGVEVILSFINGDPDRPIIIGTVPNPQTASPVLQENHKRNVIRTGGGNEINIDDEDGNERIKMSTPHGGLLGGTQLQLGSANLADEGITGSTGASYTFASAFSGSTASTVSSRWSGWQGTWGTGIYTHAREADKREKVAYALAFLGGIASTTGAVNNLVQKGHEWGGVSQQRTCFDAYEKVKAADDEVKAIQQRLSSIANSNTDPTADPEWVALKSQEAVKIEEREDARAAWSNHGCPKGAYNPLVGFTDATLITHFPTAATTTEIAGVPHTVTVTGLPRGWTLKDRSNPENSFLSNSIARTGASVDVTNWTESSGLTQSWRSSLAVLAPPDAEGTFTVKLNLVFPPPVPPAVAPSPETQDTVISINVAIHPTEDEMSDREVLADTTKAATELTGLLGVTAGMGLGFWSMYTTYRSLRAIGDRQREADKIWMNGAPWGRAFHRKHDLVISSQTLPSTSLWEPTIAPDPTSPPTVMSLAGEIKEAFGGFTMFSRSSKQAWHVVSSQTSMVVMGKKTEVGGKYAALLSSEEGDAAVTAYEGTASLGGKITEVLAHRDLFFTSKKLDARHREEALHQVPLIRVRGGEDSKGFEECVIEAEKTSFTITALGHEITIDESGVQIEHTNEQTIRMDDEKIELVSASRKNGIQINDDGVVLACGDDEQNFIEIKSSGIKLKGAKIDLN